MRRLTFARQMLVLQLLVVVVVLALATVTYGFLSTASNRENAESTALAIARTTASDSELVAAVAAESHDGLPADGPALATGPVQRIAERIRRSTGALFVVVTDDSGIRLAHPTISQLGKPVSTSPDAALAGREETTWQLGTLGDSARAKVPVVDRSGAVVGEVSVGLSAKSVFATGDADITAIVLVAIFALLVGAIASTLLARRLTRQTLGLQPAELAGMAQNQSAVISGIGEGVLGVTENGQVSVCNDRAAALLGIVDAVGRPLETLGLPAELIEAVASIRSTSTTIALRLVINDRLLFVDVTPVRRNQLSLGCVIVVRDETDIASLTRRLTAVTAMSGALRVQRHEFANRLHVIAGLLASDRGPEASRYVNGILDHGPVNFPITQPNLISEPYLQAFIGAKSIEATERGIEVRVGAASLIVGLLSRPEEVTTVLGNLFDNALDAAAGSENSPRWVEVEILSDGADLHIVVSDSGDGIPAGYDVFEPRHPQPDQSEDMPDAAAHGHGIGLPLSRDIARRSGGDVWVLDDGTDSPGATFCAHLSSVLDTHDVHDMHDMLEPDQDNGESHG